MITLFELRLELLAMLIAPLIAPGVAWLAEYSYANFGAGVRCLAAPVSRGESHAHR